MVEKTDAPAKKKKELSPAEQYKRDLAERRAALRKANGIKAK